MIERLKDPAMRARIRHLPALLRKYVREEHKLTLEDAIRKPTALPAQRIRLTDRGVLRQRVWADAVVIDPDAVRDVATFENPNQRSVGIQHVLVKGVPVIADGKMTDALLRKVVRGAGYRPAARRQTRGAPSYDEGLVAVCNRFYPGYGNSFLNGISSIYPGFHPGGLRAAAVATLYAVFDGVVCGAVIAWLYNTVNRSSAAA